MSNISLYLVIAIYFGELRLDGEIWFKMGYDL